MLTLSKVKRHMKIHNKRNNFIVTEYHAKVLLPRNGFATI